MPGVRQQRHGIADKTISRLQNHKGRVEENANRKSFAKAGGCMNMCMSMSMNMSSMAMPAVVMAIMVMVIVVIVVIVVAAHMIFTIGLEHVPVASA